MQLFTLSQTKGTSMLSSLLSIPENLSLSLGQALNSVTIYIPQEISQGIRHAYTYLPADMDLKSAALFLLYFGVAALILGVIGRLALGKQSSLNHSLSCAIGMLFVYGAAVTAYTLMPHNITGISFQLPFVTFAGDYLIVLPVTDTLFSALSSQILSLIILAFLFNLIDTCLPNGEHPVSWVFLRLVTVVAALSLQYLVSWAFRTYLPEVLVTYAPGVLLVLLAVLLASGFLSLILGLLITVVNPFLGAMYTFFFSNVIGKQVSKAVFSSAIVLAVFYLLEYAGYTVIAISSSALAAYLPLVAVMLLLWYLIGRHL